MVKFFEADDGSTIFALRADANQNLVYFDTNYNCKILRSMAEGTKIDRMPTEDVKPKSSSMFYSIVIGRFLLMNKAKTIVFVKKHTSLYYVDLKTMTDGRPLCFFKDQIFEKITDMVLTNKDNLLIYLTNKGKIGVIDLVKRGLNQKKFKISQLMSEKIEEIHSKDSSEQGSSRYLTLRISSDDEYLAAVSTEKSETGASFGIVILKPNYNETQDEVTGFDFIDRRQFSDSRFLQGFDQRGMDCIPQYVNFSVKSPILQTHLLMVFIRGCTKFFIFPIANGRIEPEQAMDMFPQASNIDSSLLVDDGCMIDDTIFITLQSHILLKITYRIL